MRELLDSGPVFWSTLRPVLAETGMELTDFIALVLRNDWRWDRAPFRLRAAGEPRAV